jgi:cob(I)alamin adenosyltransferase
MNERKLRLFEPREKVGLVVVFTGNGKGKTTAALGMALRAVGHGMKVCLIHFMKGSMYAGEFDGIKKLAPNAEVYLTGKGFCRIGDNPHPYQEHKANAQDAIKLAREKMLSSSFDILILDEINNAIELKLVDLPQVLDLIDHKPPLMHLVLTGRDAHPQVIQRAHTVTEMREIRHAYTQGIEPQRGIDY